MFRPSKYVLVLFFLCLCIYFTSFPTQNPSSPFHLADYKSDVASNESSVWSAIDNYSIYLYSIYYLPSSSSLRLLLYKDHTKTHSGHCIVHLVNGSYLKFPGAFDLVNAEAPEDTRPWLLELYYFGCPIPPSVGSVAQAAALSLTNGQLSQFKSVRLLSKSSKHSTLVSVCSPALFNFDHWLRLVTFIEFYRLAGASKIYLYVHSVSESVHRVVDLYASSGFVVPIPLPRIPHPLPIPHAVQQFETKGYYAQLLSVADCIHRTSYQTQFILLCDLDEFLSVKHAPNNWLRTRSLVRSKFTRRTGGCAIKSAKWYGNWPEVENLNQTVVSDLEIFHPFKLGKVGDSKNKRKLIVRPHLVQKMSVHFVWEYKKGYGSKLIGQNQAIIYHLRQEEDNQPWTTIDNPFRRITTQLIDAINRTVMIINTKNFNTH